MYFKKKKMCKNVIEKLNEQKQLIKHKKKKKFF